MIYTSDQQSSLAGLQDQINNLESDMQTGPKYYSVVRLTANKNCVANADVWATTDWTADINRGSVFKSSVTAGVGSGYARLVIPETGFYVITFKGAINTSNKAAIKVTKNSRDVLNGSVATNALVSSGAEGVTAFAYTEEKFNQNDVLYWSWWTDQTAGVPALLASHFGGVKATVTCKWVSP